MWLDGPPLQVLSLYHWFPSGQRVHEPFMDRRFALVKLEICLVGKEVQQLLMHLRVQGAPRLPARLGDSNLACEKPLG